MKTGRFTIDRSAYLRAVWSRAFGPRFLLTLALVFVGALLMTAQYGWSHGARILAIYFGIYAVLLVPQYVLARSRVYGKSGQRYDLPRDFEFSEAGLHARVEGLEDSVYPWSHVRRVGRRSTFFFLYYSNNGYWPIPDDAFRTDDDRQAFLDLLARRGLKPQRL